MITPMKDQKQEEDEGTETGQGRQSHSEFKLRILTKKKVSVPSGVVLGRELPPRHN